MNPSPWTPERLAAARALLAAHDGNMRATARELGCDATGLARALARHAPGAGAPAREARPPAAPPATPRERDDLRRTAEALRAAHAQLVEAERAADFFSRVHHIPSVGAPNRSRPKSGRRAATPVSLASDWHVGETVSLEETLGRNQYNLAEAKRRAANYWDHILWLREDAQRTQTCDDHVLWLGGDLISGSIHEELLETNAVPLVEQVSEAAALVLPGIRELAGKARKLVIACNHGNHGRITAKSRIKTGWANSLEVMLYRFLQASTRELENVEWHIPRAENLAIDVHSYRLQFQHGTQVKSQGGIGGVLVPLTRWTTRAARAHYYIFGHFHQAECFGNVVVNGSLIGDSAYSTALALAYREPEQVNFLIDERRGLRRFDRVSVT